MTSTDPFEEAAEADLLEQAQEADGSGPTVSEAQYSAAEADEADVLEQGADLDEDGDPEDAYPRADDDR